MLQSYQKPMRNRAVLRPPPSLLSPPLKIFLSLLEGEQEHKHHIDNNEEHHDEKDDHTLCLRLHVTAEECVEDAGPRPHAPHPATSHAHPLYLSKPQSSDPRLLFVLLSFPPAEMSGESKSHQ
ncbi:uncharacterized [Tachysurus ichikawai]